MKKIRIILFSLVCVMSIMITLFVFDRTATPDEIRVKNFYEFKKNSLDLVVIGASTAYTNYSAPLAWKEYGITSYSLGTNMAPMGLAKSMLKEVRKYQNPKLIVIDINGILYNDVYETKEGSMRLWIDNMRMSQNKIDTINELVPNNEKINYYISFLKYHSDWRKISKRLDYTKRELETKINPKNLTVMGMEGRAFKYPQKNLIDMKNYKGTAPLYKKSGARLRDLLSYLKDNNINNVVFTNMPRFYKKNMIYQKRVLNTAKKTIQEYGFKVYDFDEHVKEIGLNPEEDFYNPNHLNVYGQRKLTKYMIQLLSQNTNFTSKHDTDSIKFWNQEYKSYEKLYKRLDKCMRFDNKRKQKYQYGIFLN